MNQIREILKINEEELARGIAGTSASWHTKYANSAWVYAGNLDHKLTEGDVISVLSEYGEVDDFHLVRDEDTGKSKGFAFCKYEDARSCVIAVDNLSGVKVCGRSLRVDHVENYRLPKNLQDKEEELQQMLMEKQSLQGHAYHGKELANDFSLQQGHDVFAKPPVKTNEKLPEELVIDQDSKVNKPEKEKKRKEKESRRKEKEGRKRDREERRKKREERGREKSAKKRREGGSGDEKEDYEEDKKSSRNKDKKKLKSQKHEKEKKRKRTRGSRSPSPSRK